MTLVSAGSLIDSLEILEQRITWIQCPLCEDEVNRLRPCQYWNKTGRSQISHICVECAESVKGLTYLAAKYNLPGVDVSVRVPVYIANLRLEGTLERANTAQIIYGGIVFNAASKASRIGVLRAGQAPDQEKIYDNTYQAWFATTKILENGEAADQETEFPLEKGKWKL